MGQHHLHRYQPRYSLASIIDGRHDRYIRRWARGLRNYGGPVLLRFAQEMNGDWYPWSERPKYHDQPGDYARAWRHVHDVFRAERAGNVKWVWAPVTERIRYDEFPGPSYVDVMGVSGFNGGSVLHWSGWHSFPTIFNPYLRALHALAPDKPVEISEVSTASVGASKAGWITGMFNDLRAFPYVKTVTWFNLPKQTDWRIETSLDAQRAFAAGASDPRCR